LTGLFSLLSGVCMPGLLDRILDKADHGYNSSPTSVGVSDIDRQGAPAAT
jgi:hypothetical protein